MKGSIKLSAERVQELYNHATAVDIPPEGENAYRKKIAKTIDEEVFHSYIRRAFIEGRISAMNYATELLS